MTLEENVQIARLFEPKLVVYNKPTHGLDVKTTRIVREGIRAQAQDGVAAVVISTDSTAAVGVVIVLVCKVCVAGCSSIASDDVIFCLEGRNEGHVVVVLSHVQRL